MPTELKPTWAVFRLKRGDYKFEIGEHAGTLCRSGWYWATLDENENWGCEPNGPFPDENCWKETPAEALALAITLFKSLPQG